MMPAPALLYSIMIATGVPDVRLSSVVFSALPPPKKASPRVGVVHWFSLSHEIAARVTADAADWHAHAAETSLMLHLRPDLVQTEQIDDDPDRTRDLVLGYTVAETSRAGTTGAPSLGSAQDGAELFELIIDTLVARIETARCEQPPIPRDSRAPP